MPLVDKYPPGTFCWVDLGTTDTDGAKEYYAKLFGWKHEDMPAGPDAVYIRLYQDDRDVGAMYALTEEQKDQGVPPYWMSYVSVDSADQAAARAAELGGTVIMEPLDVMDVGRMAVIQDPTGAAFSVWQPKKHIGARLVNEPVSLCWNEIMTGDVDKAGAFYTSLFGWGADTQEMGTTKYTTFQNGERPAGGMMEISKEQGEVPPYWVVYFAVENCDATVEKSEELGGATIAAAMDIPDIGRMAVLQDPQGAVFAVVQLFNPPA